MNWPKEKSQTVSFTMLSQPVVAAIRRAYKLQRINETKNIEWNGLPLPDCCAATCLPFEEALSAKQLRYDKEEQGRDAIEVLVGIAVQLGIEQGRRMFANEVKTYVDLMKLGVTATTQLEKMVK